MEILKKGREVKSKKIKYSRNHNGYKMCKNNDKGVSETEGKEADKGPTREGLVLGGPLPALLPLGPHECGHVDCRLEARHPGLATDQPGSQQLLELRRVQLGGVQALQERW